MEKNMITLISVLILPLTALFTRTLALTLPNKNGIAEYKNRHLLDIARFMLFSMNVPKIYWGHAILTTSYLINCLLTRVL